MPERRHCQSCDGWRSIHATDGHLSLVECEGAGQTPVPRIRAALRLLPPDDITPAGVRALEQVLDAEDA